MFVNIIQQSLKDVIHTEKKSSKSPRHFYATVSMLCDAKSSYATSRAIPRRAARQLVRANRISMLEISTKRVAERQPGLSFNLYLNWVSSHSPTAFTPRVPLAVLRTRPEWNHTRARGLVLFAVPEFRRRRLKSITTTVIGDKEGRGWRERQSHVECIAAE